MNTIINPSNVAIRFFEKKDLKQIINWNCDPEIDFFFDGHYTQDLLVAEQLCMKEMCNRNQLKYVLELEGKLIGDIDLVHINWQRRETEIRIRIGEKSLWNQGLGTEAMRKVLAKIFMELQMVLVYLKVYDFNLRAIKCYEKCGFKRIGILKRQNVINNNKEWKNIILMSLHRAIWCKKSIKDNR